MANSPAKRGAAGGPKRKTPLRATPSFLTKSLDELEGAAGPAPYGSYVVRTAHALRSKPLAELTDEELRLALCQGIGLPWVVELALQRLADDAFRSGDFHRGDVLKGLLSLPPCFWSEQPVLHARATSLAAQVRDRVDELTDADGEALGPALEAFR